jgi:hypothetical protein
MNFMTNWRRKRNINVEREKRKGPVWARRMYQERIVPRGFMRRFILTIYSHPGFFPIARG